MSGLRELTCARLPGKPLEDTLLKEGRLEKEAGLLLGESRAPHWPRMVVTSGPQAPVGGLGEGGQGRGGNG